MRKIATLGITAAEGPPPTQYTLTISYNVEGRGTTQPLPGDHVYDAGTTVTVTAFPLEGNLFSYWALDQVVNYDNPINVLMDKNHLLVAYFPEIPPSGKAILNGKAMWQELPSISIPVPNATVSLNGNSISTDNAGNFSFTVDLGTYTLTISHLLFDQYTEQLNLVTEKTYDLTALLKLKMIVKAGVGVVAAGAITIPMILAFRKPAPTYLVAPSGKYER